MAAILVVLYIALYVFGGYILFRLFNKAGLENAWLAWVPIGNTVKMLHVIKKSGWNVLWLLVPIANIVFAIIWMVKFLNSFGYSGWWILLLLVPYAGALAFLILECYMAFSQKVEYQW